MFRYFPNGSTDSTSDNTSNDCSNCGSDWPRDYCPKNASFRGARHSTCCSTRQYANGQPGNIIPNVIRTIWIIFGLVLVEDIDDRGRSLDVVHRHEDFSIAGGVVK